MDEFELLINQCADAFNQDSAWKRGRDLAFGALTCLGRHTLTGMLTASGQQFIDWSSAYRLFSHQRVNISRLFDVVRSGVLQELDSQQEIVAHMDDTLLKKTGRHIPGTAWRRDPLGPPFQTNFIWGQRFLQISMALPDHQGCSQSRAIPVDFHHCPTAKRPSKKSDEKDWLQYGDLQRKLKLSKQGHERLKELRNALDKDGKSKKQLIISVDGSYTNEEVLKHLPERITLIGRIRKDTKLYASPVDQPVLGRKRVYGDRLPTPEQVRQSDQYPWQEVKAWAAGKEHMFKVKIIKNTLWRSAGQKHNLQLLVIRPLGYRLSKSSHILYREPAYLICTDNELPIDKLLQSYLWRWEIEVNFRDEKTLMGCGQAQVRNPESAESVPAFISAVYALLHLAAHKSLKTSNQVLLPRP
ncbi:MAG: transposase, partial [Fibrobacter sp.]|nr:transposase [Fibrobacter sp.]